MQYSILFATNDDALARVMERCLEREGFAVTAVGHALQVIALAAENDRRFSAYLTDADLPDGRGRELCARLRRGGLRSPVLLLGATNAEDDVVAALEAGANDFIAKPFRPAELAARLRAQIRAHENSEDAVLRIGEWHFKPGLKVLINPASKSQVRLTEKECRVLKCLHHADGRPVARRALLHDVWGYSDSADTHTVETHIYRLRRKLEPDASSPRLLFNHDGGYCLRPLFHRNRPAAPYLALAEAS